MKPLPTPDRVAADRLWAAYADAHPERLMPGERPVVECFGDHVELADELLGLVAAGTKRATAGALAEFRHDGEPFPPIGGHWIVCDGAGVPRVVLRTIELRIGPIGSVDDAFAWDEGEGDRSRDDWLAGHRAYFERTYAARGETFTEQQELVFERFRVVWPPELADAD